MESQESEASCSSAQDLADSFKGLRIDRPGACSRVSRCRVSGCRETGHHAHYSFAQNKLSVLKKRESYRISRMTVLKFPEHDPAKGAQLVQNLFSPENCVVTKFPEFQKGEKSKSSSERYRKGRVFYSNRSMQSRKFTLKILPEECLQQSETIQNEVPDKPDILWFKDFKL